MAALHADAREHPAEDDCPSHRRWHLVFPHYVPHDAAGSGSQSRYQLNSSDGHWFRRRFGLVLSQFHGIREVRRGSQVLGPVGQGMPVTWSVFLDPLPGATWPREGGCSRKAVSCSSYSIFFSLLLLRHAIPA